jgi:hypothetical protein
MGSGEGRGDAPCCWLHRDRSDHQPSSLRCRRGEEKWHRHVTSATLCHEEGCTMVVLTKQNRIAVRPGVPSRTAITALNGSLKRRLPHLSHSGRRLLGMTLRVRHSRGAVERWRSCRRLLLGGDHRPDRVKTSGSSLARLAGRGYPRNYSGSLPGLGARSAHPVLRRTGADRQMPRGPTVQAIVVPSNIPSEGVGTLRPR